jgi:chromosome segregation ATPase
MDSGGVADSDIAELNRSIDRIASGDLTHRVETDWGHTELDALASSINELVRDIESMIIETQSFGIQVSTTAETVSTRTTELQRDTETVADAVEATVTAATRQRQRLRDARADTLTLSRTLGKVTSSADDVASLSAQVASNAADTADDPSVSELQQLAKQTSGAARTLAQIESTVDEIVSALKEATASNSETVDHAQSASTATTNQTDTLESIDQQTDELSDTVADLGRTLRTFTVGSAGDGEQIALINSTYEAAVQYIETHNEQLLDRSEDLVVAYTEQEGCEVTNEVNIAGRQRMLSQRIAKTTFFIARNERAGANSATVREAKADLQSYVEEFDHALETLAAGGTHRGIDLDHAPREVWDEIDRVRAVWEPFKKNALVVVEHSQFNPEFVDSLDLSSP